MGRAGTGARRRAAHGQDRPAGGRSADGAGAREHGPVVAGGGDDRRAHPVGRRERLRHRVDAAAVEGARDPQQDHVRPVPGSPLPSGSTARSSAASTRSVRASACTRPPAGSPVTTR